MNEKLQELTNKIYQEGLEKGKQEAEDIVKKAKSEAEEILKAAKKEAEQISEKAAGDAAELKKNTESELTLSTKQAINTIKQRISDVMVDAAIDEAVGKSFSDKDFVKNLMLKMAENWDKIEKGSKDVMFFLSEKDHEKLEGFLKKQVAEKIKGGLEINFEEGIKSGFRLGPKDGSYKLSFTDEDFSRFFRQYLRPRTRKFFAED
jgi:V/A-type H+-transporting ATPase subunit E